MSKHAADDLLRFSKSFILRYLMNFYYKYSILYVFSSDINSLMVMVNYG